MVDLERHLNSIAPRVAECSEHGSLPANSDGHKSGVATRQGGLDFLHCQGRVEAHSVKFPRQPQQLPMA